MIKKFTDNRICEAVEITDIKETEELVKAFKELVSSFGYELDTAQKKKINFLLRSS